VAADDILVDLDAEAGAVGDAEMAVLGDPWASPQPVMPASVSTLM